MSKRLRTPFFWSLSIMNIVHILVKSDIKLFTAFALSKLCNLFLKLRLKKKLKIWFCVFMLITLYFVWKDHLLELCLLIVTLLWITMFHLCIAGPHQGNMWIYKLSDLCINVIYLKQINVPSLPTLLWVSQSLALTCWQLISHTFSKSWTPKIFWSCRVGFQARYR